MYMRNKFLRSCIAVLPRNYATKRSQASLDTNDEVGASFFAKHIGMKCDAHYNFYFFSRHDFL